MKGIVVLGVGVATAALLGLGYVGVTWWRDGKQNSRNGHRDPLLDRFMLIRREGGRRFRATDLR